MSSVEVRFLESDPNTWHRAEKLSIKKSSQLRKARKTSFWTFPANFIEKDANVY